MKEIKMIGRRRVGISEATGKKYDFISFSTQSTDGMWFNVKFTSNCTNIPKTAGIFKMYIALENLSINRNTFTLWVKQIEKVADITEDTRIDELATINGMWGDADEEIR